MTSENSARRGRLSRYAPLILWAALIFFLSSGSGSMSATSIIIRPILEFLFPAASEEWLQQAHHYIRKCAHFTEYAILALWAIRAFRHSTAVHLSRFPYHFAFLVVIIVALLDELNQSFSATRTGSIWDVMLDASGGLFAIVLAYIIARKGRHAASE